MVLDWHGRKVPGRKRVGGFEPRKANTAGTLYELNMPTIGMSKVAALAEEVSYWVTGVYWAVLSLAANTLKPGHLLHEQNGRICPMGDDFLARQLRLTLRRWHEALGFLMPGALDVVMVHLDLEDDEARRYEASKQLELFDAGTERGVPEMRNRNGTRTSPHSEEPAAGRVTPSPVGSVVVADEVLTELAAARKRAEHLLHLGAPEATAAVVATLSLILQAHRGVEATSRDRRDFGYWCGKLMTMRQGHDRAEYGAQIFEKLIGVCATPDIENPVAYMVRWLKPGGRR